MATTTKNHINKELAEEVRAEIDGYTALFAIQGQEENARAAERAKNKARPPKTVRIRRWFASLVRR